MLVGIVMICTAYNAHCVFCCRFATLGSLIVNQLITDGFLLDHIKMLNAVFKERVNVMCAALDTHLPGECVCFSVT